MKKILPFFVEVVLWYHKEQSANTEIFKDIIENKDPSYLVLKAHYLLGALQKIPGQDEISEEGKYQKLYDWIKITRSLYSKLSMKQRGNVDYFIGRILAKCKIEIDNIWPNKIVRKLINNLGYESKEICNSACDLIKIDFQNRETYLDQPAFEVAERYSNWAASIEEEYQKEHDSEPSAKAAVVQYLLEPLVEWLKLYPEKQAQEQEKYDKL